MRNVAGNDWLTSAFGHEQSLDVLRKIVDNRAGNTWMYSFRAHIT